MCYDEAHNCAICGRFEEYGLTFSEETDTHLCRGCSSFCERCSVTRLIHRVSWFREKDEEGGTYSACDECWVPTDDTRRVFARGDGPARGALQIISAVMPGANVPNHLMIGDNDIMTVVEGYFDYGGIPEAANDEACIIARAALALCDKQRMRTLHNALVPWACMAREAAYAPGGAGGEKVARKGSRKSQ